MYLEWLQRGLTKPGKSQAGLARHLGISKPVVSRMVSGERPLRGAEIVEIARYLGEPPPTVSGIARAGDDRLMVELPVRGKILDLGLWRSSAMPLTQGSVRALTLKGKSPKAHYAVEMVASPGHRYVLCLELDALGRALKGGDRVHVIHRRGDLEREEILSVLIDNGVLLLLDVDGRAIEIDSVEVRGIVYGDQTIYDL